MRDLDSVPVGASLQAHELTMEGVTYCGDSQDLAAFAEHTGTTLERAGYTGLFAVVGGGDYLEAWITDSPRPYAANCTYTRVI